VSLGHSQQVGPQMMNRAFSRFAHVVGYLCVSGAILDVLGYQGAAPRSFIWPAIFPLFLTLGALVLLDRFRTTAYAVAFLAIGGVSQFWFAFALLSQVRSLYSNDLTISLVNVALILVVGSGFVLRSSIPWTLAGFVLGQAASMLAALVAHTSLRIDEVAIEVEIGLLIVTTTTVLTRAARSRARPALDRAAIDEQLSALRYRIEGRAAALMHDTVLNHLAAIAVAHGSSLGSELKRQIERDLEVLIGEEWLGDPSPEMDAQARTDWRGSALLAAVQEAREQSLTVEVTGDLAAVGRLSPERDVAAGLAVRQCLVNVLRHAQVEHAEVVIIGSEREVSIMVIDAGRGFSEEHIGADRLGLRQSVRRRIEAVGGGVQLWSTPGRGTSVMLRLPATAPRENSVAVTDE
jgi:signal transduction histidine kinase